MGAPGLYVLVVGPSFTSTQVLPDEGTLLVGRAEDADLRVVDPEASRIHAQLHVGEVIEIEDLGSANGTRLREQALCPRQRHILRPGETVTIGSTTPVLKHRGSPGTSRWSWPHGHFESRLSEECARAQASGGELALMRLSLSPHTPTSLLQEAATSELRPGDMVGEYGPSEYEILLPDTERGASEELSRRIMQRLGAAGATARTGVAFFPKDGTSPGALFSRAAELVRGGEVGEVGAAGPIVASPAMIELYRLVDRVAASDINVLIHGETGAGKEAVAAALHQRSPRSEERYLCINCASFSETLLESELFGHEKGAFTGATQAKLGLLEAAGAGTVFLDEIGEMTSSLQARLLRALEAREILRVGGTEPRKLRARFVAATNRDLEEEIAAGSFRQDLYFRLNGITLTVPPLRERREEIDLLARLFLERAARQSGRSAPALDPPALELLRFYAWPGNVRELKNVMERAQLLCTGSVITDEHLPRDKMRPRSAPPLEPPASPPDPRNLRQRHRELERSAIEDALARCAGNQTRAAELLNIPRRTFCNRLKEYGIGRPRA